MALIINWLYMFCRYVRGTRNRRLERSKRCRWWRPCRRRDGRRRWWSGRPPATNETRSRSLWFPLRNGSFEKVKWLYTLFDPLRPSLHTTNSTHTIAIKRYCYILIIFSHRFLLGKVDSSKKAIQGIFCNFQSLVETGGLELSSYRHILCENVVCDEGLNLINFLCSFG